MHILMFLMILGALGFLVMWALAQPKADLEENVRKVLSGIAGSLTPKAVDWATPMRVWAETSLGSEQEIQTWLLALSSDGLQALGEKIAEFCLQMNVDLHWLSDPAKPIDSLVKQAAEEMVIDYCRVCLKAVHNQKPAQ
jgi:hypothetical protein